MQNNGNAQGQEGRAEMTTLMHLSNILIPVIIFYIVSHGIVHKVKVYEAFVKGAKEGLKTVVDILPTLIGLLMAVGVIRASGLLALPGQLLGNVMEGIGIPGEIVPLIIVKMFSSSAATGLCLDLFKEFGTDSYIGLLASILMSCTETIFYTMSVYFLAAKVTKTGWTLSGAIVSMATGLIFSVLLAQLA